MRRYFGIASSERGAPKTLLPATLYTTFSVVGRARTRMLLIQAPAHPGGYETSTQPTNGKPPFPLTFLWMDDMATEWNSPPASLIGNVEKKNTRLFLFQFNNASPSGLCGLALIGRATQKHTIPCVLKIKGATFRTVQNGNVTRWRFLSMGTRELHFRSHISDCAFRALRTTSGGEEQNHT